MAYDVHRHGAAVIGWVTSSGPDKGNVNSGSLGRLGGVSPDGAVSSNSRGPVGFVGADGKISKNGVPVGWVRADGTINSDTGPWGWVTDDKMTKAEVSIVHAAGAALLLF